MTCPDVRAELIGYHLATLDEPGRHAVEQHLEGCLACVSAFVSLKRSLEQSTDELVPSPRARSRLRAAVAQELGLTAPVRAWWHRPLVAGLAAAAVLTAMVTVNAVATGAAEPPHARQRAR